MGPFSRQQLALRGGKYEGTPITSAQAGRRSSIGGVSAALSYRIIPSVFIGVEAWYLRHYDGSFFNAFTGDAIFVGPTLYAKLGPKTFMTAAWNAQVSGHDVEVPGSKLNFGEFTRSASQVEISR